MTKIKIYTTTKGKKEDCLLFKWSEYYKGTDVKNKILDIHFEENNKTSLQSCYNKFIDDARSNNIDIALLVHDDVYINTNDIYNLTRNASNNYVVFGVAGSTACKVGAPALWHLMSSREHHRGCVAHGSPESYSYSSFGSIPSRCLLLDGVFIGIDIARLPDKVKFDESYPSKWHYYDMDFCLECNRNSVKMGVVDIPIIHNSPGLTNPNEEFHAGQSYFIKKWKR